MYYVTAAHSTLLSSEGFNSASRPWQLLPSILTTTRLTLSQMWYIKHVPGASKTMYYRTESANFKQSPSWTPHDLLHCWAVCADEKLNIRDDPCVSAIHWWGLMGLCLIIERILTDSSVSLSQDHGMSDRKVWSAPVQWELAKHVAASAWQELTAHARGFKGQTCLFARLQAYWYRPITKKNCQIVVCSSWY